MLMILILNQNFRTKQYCTENHEGTRLYRLGISISCLHAKKLKKQYELMVKINVKKSITSTKSNSTQGILNPQKTWK